MINLPENDNCENKKLVSSIDKNIDEIKKITDGSSDLITTVFYSSGIKCCLCMIEGMVSLQTITNLMLVPLTNINMPENSGSDGLFRHIKDEMLLSIDKKNITGFEELIANIMSGFAVLLIDGSGEALAYPVHGYDSRGVSEASSEGNVYGARDGFTESLRTNMSLVRRRLKTPALKFELLMISKSGVNVFVAHMSDRTSHELVESVKERLKKIPLDTILGMGYIKPYADERRISFFDGVSSTERPDVFCAKLLEGKVGILIDGTPFSVTVPGLFIENFQTIDDYNARPYYATVIRAIRYLAFIFAVFLPAAYVAMATFHPELFNHTMLVSLADAEKNAPLPLAAEAFIALIFYEIIREAGIRLPKIVGAGVSIVGGLIIGDAAVSAGIISMPLLLVCAISVTASFVIPGLNQPVTVLRLIAVIAGGTGGLFGLSLVAAALMINLCSIENSGVPATSPVSPLTPRAMRDVLIRIGIRRMAKENMTIEKLHGIR